jgi:hypothetical protein
MTVPMLGWMLLGVMNAIGLVIIARQVYRVTVIQGEGLAHQNRIHAEHRDLLRDMDTRVSQLENWHRLSRIEILNTRIDTMAEHDAPNGETDALPPREPGPTSFERVLKDDDDLV